MAADRNPWGKSLHPDEPNEHSRGYQVPLGGVEQIDDDLVRRLQEEDWHPLTAAEEQRLLAIIWQRAAPEIQRRHKLAKTGGPLPFAGNRVQQREYAARRLVRQQARSLSDYDPGDRDDEEAA